MRIKHIVAIVVLLLMTGAAVLLAHPGLTDKDGCHECKENCKVWGLYDGEFHCHQTNVYGDIYNEKTLTKQRMICYAIENKRILKFKRVGEMEKTIYAEPFQYGLDDDQNGKLIAYILEEDGEGKWETFDITEIMARDMRVMKKEFDGSRSGAPAERGGVITKELCRIPR